MPLGILRTGGYQEGVLGENVHLMQGNDTALKRQLRLQFLIKHGDRGGAGFRDMWRLVEVPKLRRRK